jgi:hypothetical protein
MVAAEGRESACYLGENAPKRFRILGFALPQRDDVETSFDQCCCRAPVSLLIGYELAQPELAISFRNGGALTTFVVMPEAAMNENYPTLGPVGDVGVPGKIPIANSIPFPKPMKLLTYQNFWSRPCLPDAGQPRRGLRIHFQPKGPLPPEGGCHGSSCAQDELRPRPESPEGTSVGSSWHVRGTRPSPCWRAIYH